MVEAALPLTVAEGRYARFETIPWWDQERLRSARVVVVGAGALGNEVIKNLALLGVGELLIVDMDHVELHNLTRSVLFRAADAGRPKAEVAAARARELDPTCGARALVGRLMTAVGLGWIRRADVVVGALDNREARLAVNQLCARVGRPWIDGGIEVLNGIVRGFHPPRTACYECTMSATDWAIVEQRRSCSLLARQALVARGVPTTPTTASVIGAMQAQEVVKLLHGLEGLAGSGFVFEGLTHNSYRTSFPTSPDCPWHETPAEVRELPWCTSATPLGTLIDHAKGELGGLDALDLVRELVAALECPTCHRRDPCWRPLDAVDAALAACPRCGGERVVIPCHAFAPGASESPMRLSELGLPAFDILYARRGERVLGFEMTGDRPATPKRES